MYYIRYTIHDILEGPGQEAAAEQERFGRRREEHDLQAQTGYIRIYYIYYAHI